MKLLDDYFKLQQELFSYFGYEQNWVTIPFDDSTMYWWYLDQDERGHGEVTFAETESDLRSALDDINFDGDYYSNEIYTQRFLKKWVYEGRDYTMVVVDTHTDGNKYLQVFDNSKRLK